MRSWSASFTFTLRFRYPGTAAADGSEAAAGTEPQRGRYRLSGDRAIRPNGIDDDGAKTYIEWAAESSLPAVYSVDAAGKESLVNGNMRDGIFVIDSVVDRLVFRLELFNAMNHKILDAPVGNASNPSFGRIISASGGRNIQLALKYLF